jgi:hypothetical protein
LKEHRGAQRREVVVEQRPLAVYDQLSATSKLQHLFRAMKAPDGR